ncbi:isoaspartyl peptidase/L-asparaginase [Sulfuracidifex metallicus]|uniref:isoaspartyl peptidase/L-asparaginase n=1 Tax=Sulfuracidifex metallicus TaxID=47303 RepID=UPI0022757134|nr:isoaspartyl peptidase/L-asparaginase [Sulfuracidifex metallicus]MCY0850338.1 isoaspartyl peptidase/L-asparaginase [Sulfuracidifex metallicus]
MISSIPVIILHGGAGYWEGKDLKEVEKAIREATERGFEEFSSGSSIEAVVEAISFMEDSGLFDAGKGSVKNSEGNVEMDAGLMDGKTMSAGSVVLLNSGNPIREALKVMRKGKHVIIAKGIQTKSSFHDSGEDTVGAVALDREGRIVAGTSTGGISGKDPGRIGDSPIPGAGFYATERIGVSSTGIGEIILKTLPAKEVDILFSMGLTLDNAIRSSVDKVTSIFGKGNIGMIGLSKYGEVSAHFNTNGMPRCFKNSEKTQCLIYKGDFQ